MQRKYLWIGAAVLVLLAGGWLAYNLLNPVVTSFIPMDGGTDLPRDTAIEITFSQPMQAESVTARLGIFPEVNGSYTWENTTLRFQPEDEWPQGEKVRITLVSGALTHLGAAIKEAYAWSFTVRPTRLAFLYPADGPADLYLLDIESGNSQQITTIGGIQDFGLHAASNTIYFSARNSNEGSNLYRIDLESEEVTLVLDCQDEYCSMVQVSTDGRQLAYERSDLDGHVAIWLMDLANSKQLQISQRNHEARLPQWSPGGLLSYYDVDSERYYILDLLAEERIWLDNQPGELATWSPNNHSFTIQQLTPYTFELPVDLIDKPFETLPEGEDYEAVEVASGNIIAFDLSSKESINLSGRTEVIDGSPLYSPDGRWLAFSRRVLEQNASTLGRQVWLMRANGSQQEALTDNPNFKYSGFAWHPDSRQLAVVRADNTRPTELPELWLLDTRNGNQARLVIGGYDPLWIP